jgi:hypothetical protein
MKKRFRILACLLALMLCLAGCAKSTDSNDSNDKDYYAAVAGTYTGALKDATPAYASEHLQLPMTVTLGADGKVSLTYYWASLPTAYTAEYTATASSVSFTINDKFESRVSEDADGNSIKVDATMVVSASLSDDLKTVTGNYTLTYTDASPTENGTIKVSRTPSGIVGIWHGVWLTNPMAANDYIDVTFASDGSFHVEGGDGDDGAFTFDGTWSLNGNSFTATSGALTVDGTTYDSGSYPATLDGNLLKDATYSITRPGHSYVGTWSLGKEL